MRPTQGEIRARLEVLSKKKRSVKRKPLSSPEDCLLAWGMNLKVGASSPPSSAAGAGESSGRAVEPPLEVLPLLAWSPTLQGAVPPPVAPDEVRRDRDRFDAAGSEDSLLSHVELAARAVSFILRDSELRKVDALAVAEALALLLQGTTSICSSVFVDPFY